MADETQQDNTIERFTWSAEVAAASKRELDLQVNAFKDRIDRIVNNPKAVIKGIPLLQHILSITNDPAELEVLGKACVRLAQLMPEYETLSKRRDLVDESLNNPAWIAATFADFSRDVDELTNNVSDFTDDL